MLISFYQNTITAIKQCFESIQITPAPELVRAGINKSEPLQPISVRQHQMLNLKYKR
jgi:hypothetical protein